MNLNDSVFTALLPEALLFVVHITEDGMSILDPLEITDTHVVVKVPHLSAFGLVWDLFRGFLNNTKAVFGQVLLFLHQAKTTQRRKLNVFLLPCNIPVEEVKIYEDLHIQRSTASL